MLAPGDTLLGMRSAHGGHRTHGAPENLSGQLFNAVHYGVDAASGEVDYDEVAALARKHRPKLVVAGFSAYSRTLDWQRFRAIADEVGALFLADIAHVAGLIAAELSPNPVPIADVTTTTTHKTLRGPRGGMILARAPSELTRRVDAAVYPGTQGGPLMHVIAAKAVAFQEALQPEFKDYQRKVVANARLLAGVLAERGYSIVSGGTDNHMLLVDLTGRSITAQQAERALEQAHIAVNQIGVPRDAATGNARVSGLRIGTAAVTTRGFADLQMRRVGNFIADLLDAGGSAAEVDRVRAQVLAMCAQFPVYGEAVSRY